MKIDIENVLQSLKKVGVAAETVAKVVKELTTIAEEEKAHKDPVEKTEKQFVVITLDPENKLKDIEVLGYVVQIDAEANPAVAIERVKAAGVAFNGSKKGQKHPVKTLAQIFEFVPRRFWKDKPDKPILSKTKLPVYIAKSDGKI